VLSDRLGFPPKQRERSFWVLGGDKAAFEAAAPVIEAIASRYPRLRVVLTGPDDLLGWLSQRFPACLVHARPLASRGAARRFVRRVNFRAVAALDAVVVPDAILAAMADEGLTLVALLARPGGATPAPAVAAAAETVATLDEAPAGAPSDGKSVALGFEPLVTLLGGVLARDIKARRRRARRRFDPASLALAAIRGETGPRLLGSRLARIDDADALAAALGRPATIMCLGNGPSSEAPALSGLAYDALFRVNHSWLARGVLAKPDVVFTGGTKTMATIRGAIFGVQSEGAERRLVGARLFRPRLGPTRFFRVPAVAPALAAFAWDPVRPTNGAAMLATAVALKPARLIVAGIDLFRHPDGAYPGDMATPNAFAPAHDADVELAFLLELFESYRGELIIVGDVLREAWERRKAG
jgi:hypothetical protein